LSYTVSGALDVHCLGIATYKHNNVMNCVEISKTEYEIHNPYKNKLTSIKWLSLTNPTAMYLHAT